jgi:hypothetical protein
MHVVVGDVVGAKIEQSLLPMRWAAATQVAASPSSELSCALPPSPKSSYEQPLMSNDADERGTAAADAGIEMCAAADADERGVAAMHMAALPS